MTLDDLRDGRATITVPELAQLARTGRNEMYAAVERGEVPGVLRVGRSIRIAVPAILAWLGDTAEVEQ